MNKQTYIPAQPGTNIYPIKDNVDGMADTAWILAMISLWPTSTYSAIEIFETKKCIRRFLVSVIDPYIAYKEFCQRILLTRKYQLDNPAQAISEIPTIWFHSNKNGFLLSSVWFNSLQQIRSKLPLHKLEMKALAEAILEMAEENSPNNFHYWITWFKERNAPDELMLFSMFTAYNNYKTV